MLFFAQIFMRQIFKFLNGELLSLHRYTDTPIPRHQPFVVRFRRAMPSAPSLLQRTCKKHLPGFLFCHVDPLFVCQFSSLAGGSLKLERKACDSDNLRADQQLDVKRGGGRRGYFGVGTS